MIITIMICFHEILSKRGKKWFLVIDDLANFCVKVEVKNDFKILRAGIWKSFSHLDHYIHLLFWRVSNLPSCGSKYLEFLNVFICTCWLMPLVALSTCLWIRFIYVWCFLLFEKIGSQENRERYFHKPRCTYTFWSPFQSLLVFIMIIFFNYRISYFKTMLKVFLWNFIIFCINFFFQLKTISENFIKFFQTNLDFIWTFDCNLTG